MAAAIVDLSVLESLPGRGSVMAKSKRSKQRGWTQKEIRQLSVLAKQKMSAATVARALRRSLDSTKKKASRLGVPLGTAKRRWTEGDLRRLKTLAKRRRSLPFIAKSLGRTIFATEKAASVNRISLDLRQ